MRSVLRTVFPVALAAVLSCCTSQDRGDEVDASGGAVTESCRVASSEVRAKLIAGLKRVELDSTRVKVEGVLGKADFIEPSASKDGRRPTGEALYYVIKSCGSRPRVGGNDEFVVLLFNVDNHLYAVVPENFSEIDRRSVDGG